MTDPRIKPLAEAIYDDASIFSAPTFTRDEAARCWPGLDARRFLALMDAYKAITTDPKTSSG